MGFSLTKWMGNYDPFSSKGSTSQRVLGGLALATAGTLAFNKAFGNGSGASSSDSTSLVGSQIKLNLAQANRLDPTYGALAQGAGALLGSMYSADAQSNIAEKQNELAKEQMERADKLEDEAREKEKDKEKKKRTYYNQMRYSLSGSGLGYV